MHTVKLMLFFLMLGISACGIATQGPQTSLSSLDLKIYGYRIRNGITTEQQLQEWFGLPTASSTDSQGRSRLTYRADGGGFLEVLLRPDGIVFSNTLSFPTGHGQSGGR